MIEAAPTQAAPAILPPPPPFPPRDPPPPPLPQRDVEEPAPAVGPHPEVPPPPALAQAAPPATAMSVAPVTVQSTPPASASTQSAGPALSPAPGSSPPSAHYSSAPPVITARPSASGFPVLSEDDLADELRPPGLFASLWRTKPGGAWFALGFIAVAAAFVGGVALGRGTAPRPLALVPVPEAPPPPKPVEATPPPSPEPSAPPAASAATAEPAPGAGERASVATPASAGPPFNSKAAATNLALAANRAHACHMRGDPAGSVTASVTFATNGRVSEVAIGAPHTGTKTALCITYKLNTVRVPPYGGSPQTVKQAVTLK